MQQKAAGRGSSRENIAIVRPSEKEPVVMVTPPERSHSPPLKTYREPASNDHSQRKPERESFLHLRGRQAPYALPERYVCNFVYYAYIDIVYCISIVTKCFAELTESS